MPFAVTVGYCHHWFGLSSAPIRGDKDDVSLAEPYTWHSIVIKDECCVERKIARVLCGGTFENPYTMHVIRAHLLACGTHILG